MIAIGCDHTGIDLKNEVIGYLNKKKISFVDFGTNQTEATDYPIYAKKVGHAIVEGRCEQGILICGTGIGVSMAANKINGIRAALCHDVFSAKSTRLHNDANVLVMGARVIGAGHALEVLEAFLSTNFSGEERHIRRIEQLEN